jgi:hypothetical protein
MVIDPAIVLLRYAATMHAEAFAEDFFRRHPHLHRFAPKRVVDKPGGSGSHPEARQAGDEVHLFPKFWHLDARTRDFVFAHELGHYVLSKFGLNRLIEVLGKLGVDPWDVSGLPFGQSNMDEAFADSFATHFLDPSELKQRYPAWESAVQEVAR